MRSSNARIEDQDKLQAVGVRHIGHNVVELLKDHLTKGRVKSESPENLCKALYQTCNNADP